LSSGDDWNVACISSTTQNCPSPAGPDFDFGSGPNLFTVQTPNGPRTIVGAGQKSGVYSAFDPDTGHLLWATQVGPGSVVGGIEWGSATDGRRIYVAIGNADHRSYTLQPSGQTATAGSWSALDAATGRILWQTADPHAAVDIGTMTIANGVLYAPSMAGGPHDTNMFALNAATGSILWQYAAGGSVNAGAAVVSGVVYWGSGYSHFGLGTANHEFFAFSPQGQ
jgi:polyvinyl alcohol dehydrogenase (cytochrome)